MTAEPLSLQHKKMLTGLLSTMAAPVSEFSFANLYLFRGKHDYAVLAGDEVYITGKAYNGDTYVMPTRDPRLIPSIKLFPMIETHGMLFPVLEEWLPVFAPDSYSVTFDEAESDYLNSVDKLANYPGNRLHSKKNLLNQFLKRYTCRPLPLTTDRLDDARKVLDSWQLESRSAKVDSDYDACAEALTLYEQLGLCGGIYYIEDEPAGFIMGEGIGSSLFALHFVKAKKEFKGIYQYMYNQFARILPYNYVALNFEQDLGIETLRQAKSSYRPEKMLKKFRVACKAPP